MERADLERRLAERLNDSVCVNCGNWECVQSLVVLAVRAGVTVKLLASMTHSSVLDPEWKSEAHTSTPGEERWGAEAFLKDDRKVFWVPGPWPLASAMAIARALGILGETEGVDDAT